MYNNKLQLKAGSLSTDMMDRPSERKVLRHTAIWLEGKGFLARTNKESI